MKTLARATLTLAVLALLAAIWQPYGPWWAWLLTGVLLLFVGAALSGLANTPTTHYRGGELGPQPDDDSVLVKMPDTPTGNASGPHVHFDGDSSDPEQEPSETRHVITTGPLGTRSQRTPTYGKPAQKEEGQ